MSRQSRKIALYGLSAETTERKINRELDAGCLRLIRDLEIMAQNFRNLRVEDSFFTE